MRARARCLVMAILGGSAHIKVGKDCGSSRTGFSLSGLDLVGAKKQTG